MASTTIPAPTYVEKDSVREVIVSTDLLRRYRIGGYLPIGERSCKHAGIETLKGTLLLLINKSQERIILNSTQRKYIDDSLCDSFELVRSPVKISEDASLSELARRGDLKTYITLRTGGQAEVIFDNQKLLLLAMYINSLAASPY
ncbi:MAG: hypothetical protein ABR981_02615 [Candidatus Micrarchaeaceae archaeon]|jgi:hypothetical protein